jgi:hypothetical protein
MKKLTPQELLAAIEEIEIPEDLEEDRDVRAVLAMTPEERIQELEGYGYTRAQLDAEAGSLLALASKEPAATPAPVAVRSVPARVSPTSPIARVVPFYRHLYPYAVAASVALAGALTWISQTPGPEVLVRSPNPRYQEAVSLREEAQRLADEQRWSEARDKLNEAKGIDPAGEESRNIVELRRLVEERLAPGDGVVP